MFKVFGIAPVILNFVKNIFPDFTVTLFSKIISFKTRYLLLSATPQACQLSDQCEPITSKYFRRSRITIAEKQCDKIIL